MTFDELILYEAVHDTYRTVESPRADAWLIDATKRNTLCRYIRDHLPMTSHFDEKEMLEAWGNYGRSGSLPDGQDCKWLEFTVLVARAYGRSCFYRGRGLGECSNEITVDRLLPGSRGGRYIMENCVIACRFHNSKRQDRTLEEYLRTQTGPALFHGG